MVSRQETARPLLTPGEIMQLPPDDELVLVSGCPPIRAKKARYYEDTRLCERVLPPAKLSSPEGRREPPDDDWSTLRLPVVSAAKRNATIQDKNIESTENLANGGVRREPELPEHEEIAPSCSQTKQEFDFADEEGDDEVQRARVLRGQAAAIARQAAMDPGDGLGL
jgi:type IV secretion system protein VirD4